MNKLWRVCWRLTLPAGLLAVALPPALAVEAPPPLRILLREKPAAEGLPVWGEGFQPALGRLLADRLGYAPVMLSLPRKRLANALALGEGDLLCGYIPDWLPGPFRWSRGFIEVSDLLVSTTRTRAPAHLRQLAGKPVGTLSGYRYPLLEQQLGRHFLRSDSASVKTSLQRLLAGRYDYAIVGEAALRYYLQHDFPRLPLNPPLVLQRVQARCALSPQAPLQLAELEQAIDRIHRDGSYAALLATNPWH